VIEVIEGPVAITRCLVSNHSCDQQVVCPLHDVWERAQNALLDVLGDTKISDVASARLDLERQLGG
jgi:DNA-binding IscR family transcriptional regulator